MKKFLLFSIAALISVNCAAMRRTIATQPQVRSIISQQIDKSIANVGATLAKLTNELNDDDLTKIASAIQALKSIQTNQLARDAFTDKTILANKIKEFLAATKVSLSTAAQNFFSTIIASAFSIEQAILDQQKRAVTVKPFVWSSDTIDFFDRVLCVIGKA